jgi:uncharacterized SAM-binding protein YcdF (DUF218 family)
MIFAMLSGLLLAAVVLAWRGHRRWGAGVAGAVLGLFLLAACGPLPRWLLARLQVAPVAVSATGWAARNAIVLLGVGTELSDHGGAPQPSMLAYGRIVRAAQLYRACKTAGRQCLLLVSGGDSQNHHVAEARVYGATLRQLGVPVQDLLLETRSGNTWQNARYSRPLLQAWAPQRVFLVSSGFHLRRALLYFAHFGMHPVPVSGGELRMQGAGWPRAWNLALCELALHEYLGIVRYRGYELLGRNPPPLPALRPGR